MACFWLFFGRSGDILLAGFTAFAVALCAIFANAKSLRSNLRSRTCKQACRRASLDYRTHLRRAQSEFSHPPRRHKRGASQGCSSFMVEVAGLELAASSTRSRKNVFFEHHYLHIVRIFRENAPFCTLFPLFPYRTFPVVVRYVVKPRRRVKSGKRRALESLSFPLTNRTRVKKST